jgi:hypothetical protein
MSDQLVGGQRFRLLTLVDNHSRESLAIEVGQRLTGDDVVRVLEGRLQSAASVCLVGAPDALRVRAPGRWACPSTRPVWLTPWLDQRRGQAQEGESLA